MTDSFVAVVTGAGSGIGRATIFQLARAGHRVVCLDIALTGAAEMAAAISSAGGDATAFAVDVRSPESVDAAVASVVDRYGRVDVLVNSAGIAFRERFAEMDLSKLDEMMAVNVRGTYIMCRASLPHLARETA